jgi:hypothetical protein
MPPRAKRKRASHPATPADSPAARRTRSGSSGTGEKEDEQEEPVLVVVRGEQMLRKSCANLREQGLGLDLTLVVGDTRITAHKTILIACSPYLRGLLTCGLAESSAAASAPVVIKDVDGAAVTACVDSMYSGTIALTGASVCAVIQAANLLGLSATEEAACAFFVGRLEPTTALDALGFAEDMAAGGEHGQKLHSQVLTYVHKHFGECAATPAFLCLATSSVASLLESDKLQVQSEEVVLSALRRWYEHDMNVRAEALEQLVPLVRFPLLTAKEQLQLSSEPLLLALRKIDNCTLDLQLMGECLPAFKASAAAVDCPRLNRRAFPGQLFAFASVDNTNVVGHGDESGGRFDEAGVLHHIATEGGTSAYVNPHSAGRVVASRSSDLDGSDDMFVAGPCPGSSYTDFNPNSWIAVDLGAGRQLIVNHYALRYGCRDISGAPRNWELQGSEDGEAWATLRRHDDDETMEAKGFFVAHWAVEGVTAPYRHFRVHQHGPNSAGDDFLACNGIELYGRLDGV